MGPIFTTIGVLAFGTVSCVIEIPKMLEKKQYRELWLFSVLLAFGTALAILKSLDVKIPNPSDLTAWIYSPLSNIMKSLQK